MKRILGVLVLSMCALMVFGQDDDSEYDPDYEFPESKTVNVNVGIGLGLDYGGIGGKLTFSPVKYVGLFGAIGFNLNGAGYNGGLIGYILPDKKVCPYVSVMYGYNAVIIVVGLDGADKTYYGPSLGFGINLKSKNKNFWNFGLNVPFHSQEYKDDFDALNSDPNIDISAPFPVQISVGYHIGL